MLIETGANQDYIFDTNPLRHAVGASYLVHELGTESVPAAARSHGARVVLSISGKALLLADDPAAGCAVIEKVSAKALREAPELEVTGAVGLASTRRCHGCPQPATAATPPAPLLAAAFPGSAHGPVTHVEALARTYELLDEARAARPSPYLRDPLLPWFEVCRDSGLPAAGNERHANGEHAAAAARETRPPPSFREDQLAADSAHDLNPSRRAP